MQFPGQGRPPVGIVFNCDMAAIDDALALALLYGFDGKNESRVIAVSVSKSTLNGAAFCEAVGRFYAGAVSGAFGGFGRTLPVGLSLDAKAADLPMLAMPLAKKNAEGAPAYGNGIHHLNDTAEPVALIRNALTAQYDQNAIVLLAGPATDLVKVLDLPGAKDLIARKVRLLVVATDEPAIQSDVTAARKLFAEWPTPIVIASGEVGEAVLFPASSIEKDFAWSPAHPVVDAYCAYKPMPYDAPTWAMSAALYAVRPKEGYFQLSEPGTMQVLDDSRTKFAPAADGKHRYLIVDATQKERIVKTYTEIASAKPVPRQFRFRPPQKKDAETPKPPAIKQQPQ
jgi:hypothetical protein